MKKGFVYKDMDDFWVQCLEDTVNSGKKRFDNYFNSRLKHHMKKFAKDNEGKHIIYSGHYEAKADHTFYIKIPKADYLKTYRRKMCRDYDRLVENKKIIMTRLEKGNIETLSMIFSMTTRTPLNVNVSYDDYINDYLYNSDWCKYEDDHSLMTQQKIADALNKIMSDA